MFTHYPDLYKNNNDAWRLDDGDAELLQVGEAFIEHAVGLDVPSICAHKGFSGGSPYATPADIGRAARRHPDANFVFYHSGFDRTVEGAYAKATVEVGINRLITSMRENGIGPNENVYAELGSTWWYIMRSPEQTAHVIGKLLKYVGEGNLWAPIACSSSLQEQIQAMRPLTMEEFQ